MRYLLPMLILFISFSGGIAQEEIKRIAVFDIDLSEFDEDNNFWKEVWPLASGNALKSIPEEIIAAYTNQDGFVVIDKMNYQLVEEERERQKSEAFLDGYTIAQGKSEGIDYLLKPKYVASDKSIFVRVFDVSTGVIFCEARTAIKPSRVGSSKTKEYVTLLIEQLNNNCFGIAYPVVRATKENRRKVKEILVAAGSNHKMEKHSLLEIIEMKEEQIGNEVLKRPVVIGECRVLEVQGTDFCIAKVTEGKRIIKSALERGADIHCKFISN